MERVMSDRLEQLAGCKNGTCPKIFRSGDRAAVQGLIDTARTRTLDAVARCRTVEIPIAVLAELSGGAEVPAIAPDHHGDAVAVLVGDVVVVRGLADTELTRRVVPGAGEDVVEVPLGILATLAGRLEVVG